jgi:hypothetical protein
MYPNLAPVWAEAKPVIITISDNTAITFLSDFIFLIIF